MNREKVLTGNIFQSDVVVHEEDAKDDFDFVGGVEASRTLKRNVDVSGSVSFVFICTTCVPSVARR